MRGEHSNLVRVFQHGPVHGSVYYGIDMELCRYNLTDHIAQRKAVHNRTSVNIARQTDEWPALSSSHYADAFKIMVQVAEGLDFLHRNNVVYRKLHPNNSNSQPQVK